MNKILTYLSLTKPRISILFAFTGIVGLAVEGTLPASSLQYWMIILGIFCVGGAANAFNQYFERDIDARMERTAKKRALPMKKISPKNALIFSLLMAALGVGLVIYFGSYLA